MTESEPEENAMCKFMSGDSAADVRAQMLADIITKRNETLNRIIRRLITALMVFTFLVVVLGAGIYIRQTEYNEGAKEGRTAIQDSTDRIKDCTDPTGKCYKDQQARGAQFAATLQAAQVAAIACAQEEAAKSANSISVRNKAIAECVKKILTD